MKRGIPLCFLRLIIYLCLNLKSRCQWRGSFSDYFNVLTGVKQGGVISPQLFTLYVDDLISRLRSRGLGCHIASLFVACLFYADDLCLIAPTRGAMQEMLTVCSEFCKENCLTFNVKKSKALLFGGQEGIEPLMPLYRFLVKANSCFFLPLCQLNTISRSSAR